MSEATSCYLKSEATAVLRPFEPTRILKDGGRDRRRALLSAFTGPAHWKCRALADTS